MSREILEISTEDCQLSYLKNADLEKASRYSPKLALARKNLEKLHSKFSRSTDVPYKGLDRIEAALEASFIDQRSAQHLAKLAFFIHFVRKNLSKDIAVLPFDDHHDVRLLSTFLQFTFGSKPVLGILAHSCPKDKYEAFDEDHVLFTIQKSVSEAQLVKGSVYTFQASKNTVKTLYFEIDKRSGLPFSKEEIGRIKKLLKREIKFCVERLVPQVFISRNEEEVLRNILTLNQEIHEASDLPQVMIQFDQQSSQEVTFTAIVVRGCKKEAVSIYESLMKMKGEFTCIQDRVQIVRYLGKRCHVEASVFKINLIKDPSLQRSDLSLNFYLARQKVSQILSNALGEFRDFNGGIIIKQRESLSALKDAFPLLSNQEFDMLETFFHSLSPIEAQATLPSTSLKQFFYLFSEALKFSISKPSDFFFRFHREGKNLFLMVRVPEYSLNDALKEILASYRLDPTQLISSTVSLQSTFFLGFLVLDSATSAQDKIIKAVILALKDWKKKVESKQVLKLCLASPVVSLDPRIGGDQISSIILKMLFEGLMRENKEGKIDYGIAQRVDISSDLKTYLFRLRNSRWSNGSSVSAFDFEYAWKKVLSPTFKTPFAYLFYPIKNAKLAKEGCLPEDSIGVKALDDFTLKVDLETPTPYFLELAAHTIYSPVNRLIDQLHPNWPFEDKDRFVCNGAFQLLKNDQNEGYELVKNQLYWDIENICLDQAIFIKANPYQSYEMFQNNDNHWIGAPLGTWDPHFTSSERGESLDFLNNSLYWVVYNTSRFPFNNQKLRKALAMAIDHSALSALFSISPAHTPLPPLHSQVNSSFLSVYDLVKAQALFQEALQELRLSVQSFPVLPLIYLAGHPRNRIAGFIKQQWEEVFGIKCMIEPLAWNVLFSRMTEGNFLIGSMGWQPLINDPIYTLNSFKDAKDPINFAKWENSNFQKVLYHAERELNLKQRMHYYRQAEEILLEEMPVIPIYFVVSNAIKKKNLSIKFSSSLLLNFKWASISPKT